jgi:hypothetical protein
MKETDLQRAICDYLALKGHFFSRTNNAPIFDTRRKAFRVPPKYTRKGWPGICLIKSGTFYGIEVKSEVGKLSLEQERMRDDIEKNGGVYIVARGVEDVQREGL